MKPTLSTIERRLSALENHQNSGDMEPLTISCTLEDGSQWKQIFGYKDGKPTSVVVMVPEKLTPEEWTAKAQQIQEARR